MGRLRQYSTPEEMQLAIDAYFIGTEKPTICGLALHLGFTSRQSLLNYEGYGPEFLDTIKTAKLLVEHSYERLLTDASMKPGSIVFALKNFGWRDTQEITITELPPIQIVMNSDGPNSVPAATEPQAD